MTRKSQVSKLEADAPGLGVEPHVDDLREVERDGGVLGLDLVPALGAAHRLAQRLVLVVSQPQAHAPAGVEADVDPRELLVGHQCDGSTSSVSTPPVDWGCRNATREPRMPRRGSLSISWSPASRTAPRAWSMSSHAYATWCRPGPFLARNLLTPESSDSGLISSTWPSPTSSRT